MKLRQIRWEDYNEDFVDDLVSIGRFPCLGRAFRFCTIYKRDANFHLIVNYEFDYKIEDKGWCFSSLGKAQDKAQAILENVIHSCLDNQEAMF